MIKQLLSIAGDDCLRHLINLTVHLDVGLTVNRIPNLNTKHTEIGAAQIKSQKVAALCREQKVECSELLQKGEIVDL